MTILMLTIGEFSRICFVTGKTLRHYDEIGLLRPEYTADNGYRCYTVAQLHTMLVISRLKKYGFSLPKIAAIIADPDENRLAAPPVSNLHKVNQQDSLPKQNPPLQPEDFVFDNNVFS